MTTLLVITGLPATGKTSLSLRLGQRLGYPVLSKDGIKERLYDTLGCDTREYSRKLGKASVDILFDVVETLLKAGTSCIIESNFLPEMDTVRVQRLQEIPGVQVLQVLCKGEAEVVFTRFRERALSGRRHPGHCEPAHLPEFELSIRQGLSPLPLQTKLIEFDTTILDNEILDGMVEEVMRHLTEKNFWLLSFREVV